MPLTSKLPLVPDTTLPVIVASGIYVHALAGAALPSPELSL